jgi:hypothetical protein
MKQIRWAIYTKGAGASSNYDGGFVAEVSAEKYILEIEACTRSRAKQNSDIFQRGYGIIHQRCVEKYRVATVEDFAATWACNATSAF